MRIIINENGWAKITAMPEDPSQYFFVLVDNDADLMMGLAQGNHQESGNQTMYYQASANPTTDLKKLWHIEAMGSVSGYESCYTFRNVSYNIWALQTEWNHAENFRTHDQFFPIEWTATIPKYDGTNGFWTIQNGRYPNEGYLGAWDNVSKANGVECALNVAIDNSRIGHFQIYSILKSDFIKLYANGEKNKNITFMLLNPSFENGHTYGWTQDGSKSLGPQGNTDFGKDGNTYAECWQPNGTINMYQEIQNMPMGTYKISFKAKARGVSSASLYANSVKTVLKIADEENTYEASIALDNNSTLKVGIEAVGTGVGQSWVACDNFQLTLVEAGLPAVTKAEGKMNKAVSDAQDAAIAEYNTNPTVANYNAALAAIEAARASIAIYEQIAVINTKAASLDEDGQEAYSETLTAYNEGTLSTLEEAMEGLRKAVKAQTTEGADMTLAIVNPEINGSDGWTCEKPNGGNGPLLNNSAFEYWIGTASNGSFDYYQVINGLPNGHYNIGVQMYNSSNGVSGDAPNGNVGLYGFANNTQKFVGIIKDEENMTNYTLEDVVVTDGTLRLGVKNNGTMGARWFVADNFTLTFVSGMTETDAALIALNTILDQAKTLIDANATATVSLKSKIATDYATYKAYTSETGIDVIKAATTDMTAQIAALNASIAAYANLKAAYEPYEGNTKVETLYNAAKEVYETATKTTDEVTAYIKEFTRGVAVATLETPYAGNAVAEGTFYLYNPASGKFLNGGNGWGTQMSLVQGGQPMKLTANNGSYTIDSHITNKSNHFVGTNGYLDAAEASFTFTHIGNNLYLISWEDGAKVFGYDGSTTVVAIQTVETIGSYWQLVSADDIKAAAMANGTKDKPFDVTSLIADYNFGRYNDLFGSWNGSPGKGGANENMNAEKYNTTFDVNQTLTNLPNGRYLVKAQAFYRAGGQGTTNTAENAFLYANDNSTAIENINAEAQNTSSGGFTKQAGDKYVPNSQSDASAVFTAGYYDNNAVEVIVIDGNLKIGFKKLVNVDTDWTLFDNVRLYYMGAESFDATMTKVGDAAYSSMYLDYPVEIPEGVEAYYVTVEGKTATMNEIKDVIPANCGVILKAAEDVDKITFTQTSTKATTDVSNNVLIGFVKDTEVNDGKAHYAFGYKGDKVAFYIPESAESDTDPTSKFTAKAHKAYIELESAPNAKLDIAWGGEATGINTIDNGQLTIDNSKAYNLNGMRVSDNYKGIVLKGGKKFLQK